MASVASKQSESCELFKRPTKRGNKIQKQLRCAAIATSGIGRHVSENHKAYAMKKEAPYD
jgi:hypothetical protein